MKLILKNFCCYENRTFDFPDVGNVLISAPSGAGKSSIARAIEFVLFGTGQKIVTFGKKKCSVEMTYKDMTIIRSKCPNRLVVNYTMEDDEGQSYIDKLFPDKMSTFLSQKNKRTFVVASPAEKLEYLEQLAFGDLNLPSVKEAIKHRIRLVENKIIEYNAKLDTFEVLLKECSTTTKMKKPTYEGDLSTIKKESGDLRNQLSQLNTRQYDYFRYIESVQSFNHTKQRIDNVKNEIETLDEKLMLLEEIPDQLETINYTIEIKKRFERLTSLESELENQTTKCLDTTRLDTKVAALREDLNRYDKDLKDYEKDIRDLESELSLCKILENTQDQLNNLKIPNRTLLELEKLRDELLNNIRQYKEQESVYQCPNCESSLQLIEEELIVFKKIPQTTSMSQLNKSLREVDMEYRETMNFTNEKTFLENQLTTYRKKKCRSRTFLQSTIETLKPEKESLSNILVLFNRYKEERTEKEIEYKELQRHVQKTKHKIAKIKEGLAGLTNPTETMDSLIQEKMSINAMNERKTLLENRRDEQEILLDKYTSQLVECLPVELNHQESIHTTEKKIQELEVIKSQLEQYKEYELYQSRLENYNKLKENISRQEKRVLSLQTFYKIFLKAEAISIQTIIQTINTNVQHYLDAFFDQDPFQATLVTDKVSKTTKNQSTQIHVQLFYKENDIDINTLSGGEYDRLVLAFVMALSDLNGSPFIILDECVGSLDQATATMVCDYLKNQCDQKLVLLIAHQIVTGIFDRIINLT